MMEIRYLELLVRMTRLLLPFTHGIDVPAVVSALALARRFDATLVLLSLIHLPPASSRGARWEDIQQSRDFLEFVQGKAGRLGVSVERIELHTRNPVGSARALAREMKCAGIVVAVRRGSGVLLATSEVKGLLEKKDIPLYVVSLPGKTGIFSFPRRLREKASSLFLPRRAAPGAHEEGERSVE